MGKKIRTSSHTELAHAHGKGTPVRLFQIAIHDVLGACGFTVLNYTGLYWHYAEESFNELSSLLERVKAISPSKSQIRFVHEDNDLLTLFSQGCNLIESLYLYFQHFTTNQTNNPHVHKLVGDTVAQAMESKTLDEKLQFLIKDVLKAPELITHQGYVDLVGVWSDMRDALQHPKSENTINCQDNGWDKVPFAWILAGKHIKPYQNIVEFKNLLLSKIKEAGLTDPIPGKITVNRGLKFDHQFKKPTI